MPRGTRGRGCQKRKQHPKVLSCMFGRNERIRTSYPFVPNEVMSDFLASIQIQHKDKKSM